MTRPAKRAYLIERDKQRKQLIVQARVNGRIQAFWVMTEPLIVSVDCPACGARRWQHCVGHLGQPKARPHNSRIDAYTDAIANDTATPWQFILQGKNSSRAP